MKKYLSILIRFLIILTLIFIIVLIAVLKINSDIAEVFTRTVARAYGKAASFVSGLIPFMSLTELLFVSLFALAILLIVFCIIDFVKGRFVKAINRILDIPLTALIVIAAYSFSCEMAYNRHKLPLPYYEQELNREDYVSIYNYFADDLNVCIQALSSKDNGDVEGMKLTEVTKEVKKAYEIVKDPYFSAHFGSVKPMASSFIYREFQITGVTFSPLSEANINTMNTNVDIPFTVAHELAHTKGVMREDDANQLAFYVCLNSESPYLRYSAYVNYFYQMRSMASSTYLTEEELSQLHAVDIAYNKTNSYVYDYWKKHDLLTKIGDFINDLYIKSSGVDEGTNSYSGGTEYDQDPTTKKLIPSLYQKLFFAKYFNR